MSIVVPCERRNAIALVQSPSVHRIRQLTNTSERVRVGVAVAGVIPRNRYDLLCTMNSLGVFHNRRNRQWEIHHQALHDLPLYLDVCCCYLKAEGQVAYSHDYLFQQGRNAPKLLNYGHRRSRLCSRCSFSRDNSSSIFIPYVSGKQASRPDSVLDVTLPNLEMSTPCL